MLVKNWTASALEDAVMYIKENKGDVEDEEDDEGGWNMDIDGLGWSSDARPVENGVIGDVGGDKEKRWDDENSVDSEEERCDEETEARGWSDKYPKDNRDDEVGSYCCTKDCGSSRWRRNFWRIDKFSRSANDPQNTRTVKLDGDPQNRMRSIS